MTRAAPHQGTEEDLGRHVRAGQVQDRDDVGLGQERAQPGHVLLQGVTGQVQVGQAVQAQLVGDEGRGQAVGALA